MSFRVIDISGVTPFERGEQHGKGARQLIERGIRSYQESFEKDQHVSWDKVRAKAMRYVDFLAKDYGDLLDEIRGIGNGAGVDFEDMMVLNTRYELLKFPIQECTTYAVMPEASADRHVYLGMNWDNVRWMENSSVLLRVDEQNGMKYFCMTEAGQLIRHGFNNFGIGLVTNNLLSTGDRDEVGVPTNFMRRRILTSKTLEEAVESVNRAARAVSCNLMIGSACGEAADLEVNPAVPIERKPREGILTHANHFTVHREICRGKGANFRDVRLYSLLERRKGEITPEYIMECLRDHYRADPSSHEAICKHEPQNGESGGIDPAKASVTIASQIYDLTEKKAWICKGNPCENGYEEYKL